MNKSKKLILVATLVILVMLIFGFYGYTKGIKENKHIENTINKEPDNIELTKNQSTALELLLQYGKDIYNKEIYKTLEKNEEGIFFASLEDLEKIGYDIKSLNGICHKKYTGINFDIENKLVEKYTDEPINISINCNEEPEITKNNEKE